MTVNERRICEYFLISGFNKTREPYDLSQIYYQGEEIVNANVEITEDFFHYKEPVVDIQIVVGNSNENLPEGYHIVDKTYSKQHKADLNGKAASEELYLCFRYGRDQPPITDIWAFNLKQKYVHIQDHWTLIEKTWNGHSANLNSSSSHPLYIGYKRASANAPVDNLAVTDICVILRNKNELCPPAYARVDVPIKRAPLSHTINICYKKSMVKENVLSFQPEIIYCLPCTSTKPIVDLYNPDPSLVKPPSCLPEDICDVANFCMPWGATLESWSSKRCIPKPSFLTFVLTNVNYNRMYGAAVLFYEEIDEQELTDDEIVNLGLKDVSKTNENTKIFSSKSLCLLSRWPLFQTFNQVLSFIIQEDERQKTDQSSNFSPFSLPIERFISQFLHTVHFPTPRAPNILLQWDLENPIGIQLPTDALSRFGTGENFYHLVRMLDVEQIIQLFVYMLTEQKILLTSTCNSDLTGIAEALIAMIFPFKWSVVYIPFLYLSCIHIIQSPSPYLIGVDSRFFDFFRLPDGVGCIDLVTKSIKPPDNNCKYLDYTKVLPKSVLKSLRNGLTNCKTKVLSFEKQQDIRKTTGNVMDEFTIIRKRESIGESIRECFLRAVILMFKNYQTHLISLSQRPKHDDMFDVDAFLKSVDRSCRILYQAIFETQLWNSFILERSYATEFDDGLVFFDRCIKSMRDMDDETANATSLLQTDSIIKSEHTQVIPPPDPIADWVPITPRQTFPRRLLSDFMLPSIHVTSTSREETTGDNSIDLNYSTPLSMNSDNQREYGSVASLTTADSSIPVLQISHDVNSSNVRNRRSAKVTMLKRPFEELKQARSMGKEAKYGSSFAWAGHLLSSSYCLWFLSLPGLIGHIQNTPGLKETGLAERVLQLALELLHSLGSYRLTLPDEVCYRVLLILIHQLRPLRLHVSELPKHSDLNAFSYGLCNQIMLEQEQESSQLAALNNTNVISSTKYEQTDSAFSEKSIPFNNEENELKEEKDCDSGHATMASNNLAPEETPNSSDSGFNTLPNSEHLIEIGGKPIRLRGRHQTPRNHKDRVSQLIIYSPMEHYSVDTERSRQFFDPKAGIIMSATDRQVTPILAMYRSPNQFQSKISDAEAMPQIIPNVKTESTTPAMIARTPFSEERSELHSSYLTKNRKSVDNSSNSSDKDSSVKNQEVENFENRANILKEHMSKSRMSDSRLTQSNVGQDKVALKTRASFRQLKNVANKSLRSMRDMMNSVGTGSWLNPDSKHSMDSKQKQFPAGLPTPFRPWNQTSNNFGNGINSENRLKTTASADLLDTLSDQDNIQVSRPCAGTVQQLRRSNNMSRNHWHNSNSCESFNSDQKFDQCSSTNSLDTEPPFATTDKLYDKVTGALGAIRLPTGKYWPQDQIDNESPSPCIECTQSIVVCMTTRTDCDNCHQSVYDDDIMNGWSYDDSDLQSVCPYCVNSTRFTPKLSFQVSIVHPDYEKKPNNVNKESLAFVNNYNYISPFVLRKELESVLHQEGEASFLKPEFINEHPILYWNLVWYYSRLGLPTHLLSFLTNWLRRKGQILSANNEDNKSKYQILVALTGFEQVSVSLFWEFNQIHGKMGLPLYRRYNRGFPPANYMGPPSSPTINPVGTVLNLIERSDLFGAICTLLKLRSFSKREVNGLSSLPLVSSERSVYRELFFLLIVTEMRFDDDLFHVLYNKSWHGIQQGHHGLTRIYDKPPSDSTLYCRKFFRPLILNP